MAYVVLGIVGIRKHFLNACHQGFFWLYHWPHPFFICFFIFFKVFLGRQLLYNIVLYNNTTFLLHNTASQPHVFGASLVDQRVKNPPASAGDAGSIRESGRSPGEGEDNPLQHSCLENPHGQRSLAGYSPSGGKESDTLERLTHTHLYFN